MASVDARIKIDYIHLYVPQFTTSIQQQGIFSKQVLSKAPTELRYIERSGFTKEVKNKNLWKLKLGSQKNMNDPIWICIGFQKKIGKIRKD